mmetsp:Transcript_19064/g.47353  ORF Transcript_19064/g.47353 Transcript_19064/m.47353 type:complete len:231 (-) Transcript_19064:166-858(-)
MDIKFTTCSGIGWNSLSDNHFQESRLTGTVCTQNDNTTRETHLQIDIGELILLSTLITEVNVFHFKKLLRRCLHTFKPSGFREVKLETVFVCSEFKVVLCLRLELHKATHLCLVKDQTAVGTPNSTLFVVNNVRTNIFEEFGVVGNHKNGLLSQTAQVIGNPGDRTVSQVVGRFVKKEDIGLHQNSSDQSQLHLPTSRQCSDSSFNHLVCKVQFLHFSDNDIVRLFGVFH